MPPASTCDSWIASELDLDAEISVKLTQLGFDLDREATMAHMERLADRSAELGRTLWIDMESTAYVDGTIEVYRALLAKFPNSGLCLQAYLRRTWDDVQVLAPAEPSIRLVKGRLPGAEGARVPGQAPDR